MEVYTCLYICVAVCPFVPRHATVGEQNNQVAHIYLFHFFLLLIIMHCRRTTCGSMHRITIASQVCTCTCTTLQTCKCTHTISCHICINKHPTQHKRTCTCMHAHLNTMHSCITSHYACSIPINIRAYHAQFSSTVSFTNFFYFMMQKRNGQFD